MFQEGIARASRQRCYTCRCDRSSSSLTPAPPVAKAATTCIERRAADVLVIGDSSLAKAAAYSLAKRGRKVLVIPSFGVSELTPKNDFKPLHIPNTDLDMVNLANDACAYWRGLEALVDKPLMRTCGSLCLGASKGNDPPAEMLGQLQDACKSARVSMRMVRADDVAVTMPAICFPQGFSALFQPDGAILDTAAANRALTSLGERSGVLHRDRLILRGWRDEGDHFAVRASSSLTPGLESVFEVEQLMLMPDPEDWLGDWEALLGIQSLVEVRGAAAMACPAGSGGDRLPLLHHLGGLPGTEDVGPGLEALGRCWVHPPPRVGAARLRAVQGPSDGLLLHAGSAAEDEQGRAGASSSSRSRSSITVPRPDRLTCKQLHGMANTLIRGMGELPSSASRTILNSVIADGWPLLGWHPGFEDGRALIACCTSGGHSGGWDNYQLTPILAKMACELALGSTPQDVDMSRLAPTRDAVKAAVAKLLVDPWQELGRLQPLQTSPTADSDHADPDSAQRAE